MRGRSGGRFGVYAYMSREEALALIKSGKETCVVLQIEPPRRKASDKPIEPPRRMASGIPIEPRDACAPQVSKASDKQHTKIVYAANGRGVSPLLALYRNDPAKLKGSCVFDTIIGKAAAAILVLGGARAAYGEVMSAAARDYLARHNISAEYGALVDAITNRSGDGICPIEKSVLDAEDPGECLARIEAAVKALAPG